MKFLCIGDTTIDQFLDQSTSTLGGCAFNLSWNLKNYLSTDDDVYLLTALANNKIGKKIEKILKESGIHVFNQLFNGEQSVQKIKLASNGERIFCGFEAGVLNQLILTTHEMMDQMDYISLPVFQETYLIYEELITKHQILEKCIFDFMDLNEFENSFDLIKKAQGKCYLMQFGLNLNQHSLIERLKKISNDEHQKILITLGESGQMFLNNGQVILNEINSTQNVVDTTGAGDCFMASFLSCYLNKLSVSETLKISSERAMAITQSIGATPFKI